MLQSTESCKAHGKHLHGGIHAEQNSSWCFGVGNERPSITLWDCWNTAPRDSDRRCTDSGNSTPLKCNAHGTNVTTEAGINASAGAQTDDHLPRFQNLGGKIRSHTKGVRARKGSGRWACPICGAKFTVKSAVHRHAKKTHPNALMRDVKTYTRMRIELHEYAEMTKEQPAYPSHMSLAEYNSIAPSPKGDTFKCLVCKHRRWRHLRSLLTHMTKHQQLGETVADIKQWVIYQDYLTMNQDGRQTRAYSLRSKYSVAKKGVLRTSTHTQVALDWGS